MNERSLVAPVLELLERDRVRAARHESAHRLLVAPEGLRPEDAGADRAHVGFDAAVARARLLERAEGEPDQGQRKAQAADAKAGDGDEGHGLTEANIASIF